MHILAISNYHINLAISIIMVACLIIVSIIDIKSYLIPDFLTLPTALIILVLSLIYSPINGVLSAIQALLVFGFLFAFSRMSRKSFGMGDVKLMATTALTLPLIFWLLAQIFALIICLVVTVILAAMTWLKRDNPSGTFGGYLRKIRIPLAPYIAAGYIVVILFLLIFQQ